MADIRQNTTIKDDFNRADELTIAGPNWANVETGPSPDWSPAGILNNRLTLMSGAGVSFSYWTPESFDNDAAEAWAYGSGGGAIGVSWSIGLFRDVGGTAIVDGYRLQVVGSGNDNWELGKYTNKSFVVLALGTGGTTDIGFTLLRRNGTSVEAWHAGANPTTWSLIVSAVDSTYTTGLFAALGSSGGGSLCAWDDFGSGPKKVTTFLPQIYRRTRLRGGR